MATRTPLRLNGGEVAQFQSGDTIPSSLLDAALDSLVSQGTGIVARTASGTFTSRTITGTANQVTIANGDGVPGNPTASLPSDLRAPGTIRAAGTVQATSTGVDGTLADSIILCLTGFETSYLSRIRTSTSASAGACKVWIEVCDGTSTGHVTVFRGFGDGTVVIGETTFNPDGSVGIQSYLVVAGTAAGTVVGSITAADSQSANIWEWRAFGGTVCSTLSENGYLTTRKNSLPADGELSPGEAAWWFDDDNTTPKIHFKAKTADGTPVTFTLNKD